MKQQILEILDKSTNNGMKAEEIMEAVRKHMLDCVDEFYDNCVDDSPETTVLRDDQKIFTLGRIW